jgi:hypothetical protein
LVVEHLNRLTRAAENDALGEDLIKPDFGFDRGKLVTATKQPKRWNTSSVNHIIHSDSLLGWYQQVGPPINDCYPTIASVTPALVQQARAQIASRRSMIEVDGEKVWRSTGGRKGSVVSNLFTGGIAKRTVCGSVRRLPREGLIKPDFWI